MKFRSLAILAALAVMPAPFAVSARERTPSATISADDQLLIQRAINRGQLMYAYDQAAWHGTDDLRIKLPDFATRIEGWIVDGPAQSPHLIFYSRDKDRPTAVYVADFRDYQLVSSKVLGPKDDATLSPAQLKLIEARRTAKAGLLASDFGFCAEESPNSIVLPPETPNGPYLVYFLTPQTSNDSVPGGGHYLFEVSDGKVLTSRRFTKGCIDLAFRDGANDKSVAALMITHLLDPTPTEIHVFTMFAARLPLFVMTEPSRRLWAVEGPQGRAQIRLIDRTGK